jgi:hypothetical protein
MGSQIFYRNAYLQTSCIVFISADLIVFIKYVTANCAAVRASLPQLQPSAIAIALNNLFTGNNY